MFAKATSMMVSGQITVKIVKIIDQRDGTIDLPDNNTILLPNSGAWKTVIKVSYAPHDVLSSGSRKPHKFDITLPHQFKPDDEDIRHDKSFSPSNFEPGQGNFKSEVLHNPEATEVTIHLWADRSLKPKFSRDDISVYFRFKVAT
jgi:hypothetical protein